MRALFLTLQNLAAAGWSPADVLRVMLFLGLILSATTRLRAQAVTVRGGDQTLNITTSALGAEPTPVVNTSATIRYRRQAKVSKITVQTSCPGQKFNLAVVALGVNRGIAAPEVDLDDGMPAVDFILNIPRLGFTTSTPRLQYTASSTFAQGNSAELGNDVHRVTYTILAQ